MKRRRFESLCSAASVALLAGCGSPAGEVTDQSSSAVATPVAVATPSVWQPGFTSAGIVAGLDIDRTPLYPCRAILGINGQWTPGKTRHDWNSCAVSYGGQVYSETTYETLAPEWIPELSGAVPANAFPAGSLNGQTLYACRATFGETLELGKTGGGIAGCSIPFDGIELVVTSYEVLSTPSAEFGFMPTGYDGSTVPYDAIQAGTDASGAPLYPCFVSYEGNMLPGQTHAERSGTQLYCEIASNGSAVAAGVGFNFLMAWIGAPNGKTFLAGQDTGGGGLGICTASGPYASVQIGKYIPSLGLCDYPYGASEIATSQYIDVIESIGE